MSKEKSPRSIQEIQSEYQNLCLKAGHVQYQLYALQKDLDLINSSLRDLNLEAAAAQAEAKKQVVEEVKSEPVAEVQAQG